MCLWGEELGFRCKALPPSSPLQESVPVSSYQQAGIPTDLKRKIARLGINMLLKMVSGWRGGGSAQAQPVAEASGRGWGHCLATVGGGQAKAESALETAEPTQMPIRSTASCQLFLWLALCQPTSAVGRVGRKTRTPPGWPTVRTDSRRHRMLNATAFTHSGVY